MTPTNKERKIHLAHKRAAAETRRYQVLEMFKAGVSERQIAKTLGIGVSTTHRDVQRVLGDLARKFSGVADEVRALQMDRYTTLLSRWWPQALSGDEAATNMVLKIMHRISEINGVIPDRPMITIDQRSISLTQGEVTFNIEAASGKYLTGHNAEDQLSQTESIS